MSELLIHHVHIQRRKDLRSKNKRNRKKLTSVYEQGKPREIHGNVYQKAVEEYEEYKRVFKHNPHESREEVSTLDHNGKTSNSSKNEMKVRSVESKPFNFAGKSVLTYK